MKKYVSITMFVFWTVVVAILTSGLVFYQNNKTNTSGSGSGNASANTPSVKVNVPAGQSVTLSKDVIAKHNKVSDCWIIVSGKVYDVTSVMNAHPGGTGTISPYCGKEATNAFQTKDIGNNHSGSAYSWLDQLLLGTVGQTITGGTVQKLQTSPPAPTRGGRRFDD